MPQARGLNDDERAGVVVVGLRVSVVRFWFVARNSGGTSFFRCLM